MTMINQTFLKNINYKNLIENQSWYFLNLKVFKFFFHS